MKIELKKIFVVIYLYLCVCVCGVADMMRIINFRRAECVYVEVRFKIICFFNERKLKLS